MRQRQLHPDMVSQKSDIFFNEADLELRAMALLLGLSTLAPC
jgi:hypothetical protein